jgi:hypothetical protein
MAFDYLGAKNAGYSDEEINGFLKQSTGKAFDFEGARKSGYADEEINGFLANAKAQEGVASVSYNKPTPPSSYNTNAVAAQPELYKEAPDDVKSKAASNLAFGAIEKQHNSKPDDSIFTKAMNTANGILQKLGFAKDLVTSHPIDALTGNISSNDISNVAKKHISDQGTLDKLSQLQTGYTDADLIAAKKTSNPSRVNLIDEFITHIPASYTPQDMQKYADGLHDALDGRYDIKLMKGEHGKLVPFAKSVGSDDAEFKPLQGDFLQELKTSFLANSGLGASQIAGGMAANELTLPIAERLAALPSVWGKIASGALQGASFGVGAVAATPVGVAIDKTTTGNALNTDNIASSIVGNIAKASDGKEILDPKEWWRDSKIEMADSALFDAATVGIAGTARAGYEGIKPYVPDITKALGDFGKWSAGRYIDGNSPSIENTFGKYGIKKEDVATARADRQAFQSVEDTKLFDTPEFMQKMPFVAKISDTLGELKAPWIDAKRADALDTALASKKLHGEIIRTAEEFPTKSRVYADNVEMMDHSIMEELRPMLNSSLEIRTKNELTGYTKEVSQNYGAMKDTWSLLFPEKISVKAISGLEGEIPALRQSISARDQNGAAQIEKVLGYLEHGDNVSDLIALRQDINYMLSKPQNSWNLDVALRNAKASIDTNMEAMAKGLNKEGQPIGDELWSQTQKAVSDYREMKTLQDESALFRRLTLSDLQPQEFSTLLYKYANQIDAEKWRPVLAKLSPETMEELENSAVARIVGQHFDNKAGVIDWTAVGEKLATLKPAAFATETAQKNLATLKAAAEQFWMNKDIHEAARNAAVRTPSGGIGTEIINKIEFFIITRWFKRIMMFTPYDASRAMAFRYQLGEAMAAHRTPMKVIAQLQSYRETSPEAKKAMGEWLNDIVDALPKAKQETIAQIRRDIASGMDKKVAVDRAMKQYRELEEQVNLASLKQEADAANKGAAFNKFVKDGRTPQEIAATLRLEYKPQTWTVDAEGVVHTGEWPKDSAKLQDALDRNYAEKVNPSPTQLKGEFDNGLQNQTDKTTEKEVVPTPSSGVRDIGSSDEALEPAVIEVEKRLVSKHSGLSDEISLPEKFVEKMKTLASDIFPPFMGNKAQLSIPVIGKLLKKVPSERQKEITEVVDYFGGSGSWGIYLSSIFPNVKKITIYEYNPQRAIKIFYSQQRPDELIKALDSDRVRQIAMEAINSVRSTKEGEAGSWGGALNYVDAIIEKNLSSLKDDEIAAIQFLADYPDRGNRNLNDLIGKAQARVNAIGRYAAEQRANGIRIEYKSGSSYDDIKEYAMGKNVLNVFDPPYYKTSGYNGVDIVGIDIYRKTHDLIQKFGTESKGLMLYTDELWHAKAGARDEFNTQKGGGKNAYELFDGIIEQAGWIDTYKVSNRLETIWFKDGKGERGIRTTGENTDAAATGRHESDNNGADSRPDEKTGQDDGQRATANTDRDSDTASLRVEERGARDSAADARGDLQTRVEPLPELSPYQRTGYEVIASDRPQLADASDRLLSGNGTKADYDAMQAALSEYDPKELKEAFVKLKSPEISPAKNIDTDEARTVVEAINAYAPNSAYKELGKRQSTLNKLVRDIEEGNDLTPEQQALYADMKSYAQESGAIATHAERNTIVDNRADMDSLGEYLDSMRVNREAVEAEAAQINKIVQGRLVRMDDSDVEETLKGMGIVDKITRADDVALYEITPEWVNAVQARAQSYYKSYKSKEMSELERVHTAALDRVSALQERLYAHPDQAKALADKKAIAQIQNEIGKLKAVEWASGGMLRAQGAGALAGGVANGLVYDQDGNIVGIDSERFLVGLVGGAMAGAIIKGKAGQKALEIAAKKLDGLKEQAVNEGNTLAAKIHDSLMSSYFAPAKFIIPYAESEMMGIAGTAAMRGRALPRGFYSKLEQVVEEKMPNRFGATALKAMLKKAGVKDEEMKWSGLDEYLADKGNVTRQEVLDAYKPLEMEKVIKHEALDADTMKVLRDNNLSITHHPDTDAPAILDTEYGDIYTSVDDFPEELKDIPEVAEASRKALSGTGGAKFTDQKVEGVGTNYREILTTLPASNGKFKSSHWNEPNVLYHTRVQDTTIGEDRTLLVEEIQSDWHQKGRSEGYKENNSRRIKSFFTEIGNSGEDKRGVEYSDGTRQYLTEEEQDRLRDIAYDNPDTDYKKVPAAPYSKTWHEKAMKDIIDDAVRNDYDRVAWTVGDIQNDRYSLSKFADEILYNEKSHVVQAKKDGKEVVFKSSVAPEQLESVIGKEATRKLMAGDATPNGGRKISGQELEIGGDGMRGFYDKILPDYTRGYIKKWGSQLEKTTLDNGAEVWSFPVTQKMSEEVKAKGQPLYAIGAGAGAAGYTITQDKGER